MMNHQLILALLLAVGISTALAIPVRTDGSTEPEPDEAYGSDPISEILDECMDPYPGYLDTRNDDESYRKTVKKCFYKCECYRTSVEQEAETEDFGGFDKEDVQRACDYVREWVKFLKEMSKEEELPKGKELPEEEESSEETTSNPAPEITDHKALHLSDLPFFEQKFVDTCFPEGCNDIELLDESQLFMIDLCFESCKIVCHNSLDDLEDSVFKGQDSFGVTGQCWVVEKEVEQEEEVKMTQLFYKI